MSVLGRIYTREVKDVNVVSDDFDALHKKKKQSFVKRVQTISSTDDLSRLAKERHDQNLTALPLACLKVA